MKSIDIDKLLEIGIALSGEKDCDKLLYTILTAAMDVTNCDGGTLYTLGNDILEFRVMINKSMGVNLSGDAITMPPIPLSSPSNVCSRTARAGTLINIPDVYNDDRFDFSGTRRYDDMTGYKTVSLLCLPMKNDHGEVNGVLQLINSQNDEGRTIPFDEDYEKVIMSLASQSAICLTNRNYAIEITELFNSFVKIMSTAIDARSPYNANHTRNMVKYCQNFISWLNQSENEWHFNEHSRDELVMSIWLHDIGKLVTPLEVMNKETRLGPLYERVRRRLEAVGLYERIHYLEGKCEQPQYEHAKKAVHDAINLIEQLNTTPFVTDENLNLIRAIAENTYSDSEGNTHPWLLPDEVEALSVRTGTLTGGERAVMQSHVEMTAQMLSNIKFTSEFSRVPQWAVMHHEFINGKGYPNGLSGNDLPREVRLITILDVFDALTARDRPYKKPMTSESAFAVLTKMADDGQIDKVILELFMQSNAYTDLEPQD